MKPFYRPIERQSLSQPVLVSSEVHSRMERERIEKEERDYTALTTVADDFVIGILMSGMAAKTKNTFSPDTWNARVVSDSKKIVASLDDNEKRTEATEILKTLKSIILSETGEEEDRLGSSLISSYKDKYSQAYHQLFLIKRQLNTGVAPADIVELLQQTN